MKKLLAACFFLLAANGAYSIGAADISVLETYLAVRKEVALPPDVSPAPAGGQLTVWSYTSDLEEMIDNYFKKDNPAIQVGYSFTPFDLLRDKLDRALRSGSGAPEVFGLESALVREYVESGLLLDLTDIYEENKDWLLTYPVEIGTYNGRVYALSWQVNPGAMFYRRSMAKKYLGTDDPQVVQNYFSSIEKMMETAALLKERSGGTCVLTAGREDLFIPFLYARKSPWIVNGRLEIDPAMEQYMDICKTLYDERMEGKEAQWSFGWFEGMNDELDDRREKNSTGKKKEVISYFFPDWGLRYVLRTNARNAEGDLVTWGDWAMVPGPVPYNWGGTWLAAYKDTPDPAAAKEFIRYIAANDNFHERWARDKGDLVTSLPALQRVKDGYSEPFLSGQNHYALFAEIAHNVNGALWQKTDTSIENLFREAVTAYVEGEKTREQALADFKRQVQRYLGL